MATEEKYPTIDTMTQEIRDKILSGLDNRFTQYDYNPVVMRAHPSVHGLPLHVLQHIKTLWRGDNMRSIEYEGKVYKWINHTYVLAHMFDLGVVHRSTLTRWFNDICNEENPLLLRKEVRNNGFRYIYYHMTEECENLFTPQYTRMMNKNAVLEDNSSVEDPFSDEFKAFWERLIKIPAYKTKIMYKKGSRDPNAYALNTQTYWKQLLKGTFSSTNKFPELTSIPTEDDILSAIQFCNCPDGTAVDGLFVLRNFGNKKVPPKSPILEWLAKYQRGLVMEDGSEAVPLVTREEMDRKFDLYRPDYIWTSIVQGYEAQGSYTILASKLGMKDGDERMNRIHCDIVDGLKDANTALKEAGYPEWSSAREIGKLYLEYIIKESGKVRGFNLDTYIKNTVPWNTAFRDLPVWFNFCVWVYFTHNKMVELSTGMQKVKSKADARKQIEY